MSERNSIGAISSLEIVKAPPHVAGAECEQRADGVIEHPQQTTGHVDHELRVRAGIERHRVQRACPTAATPLSPAVRFMARHPIAPAAFLAPS